MNNNKTDIKYTWDLSKFYKSDAEWYADFKNAQSYVGRFLEFKGTLNNKVELKKYFDFNKEVSLLIDKLYMYNVDPSDDKLLENNGVIGKIIEY